MASIGKIARRTFLLGSAAIAGGVAFGFYEYNREPTNPLEPAEGETALNPYLLITKDGVTVITPRAEMGQGIHTTLSALVAEELDIPFEQVRAEHGPASATYFNAAVMGIGLPFADYQNSSAHKVTSDAVDIAAKFIGMQVTGGSTSTVDAFVKMRQAGAAARQVLLQAAAQRAGRSVGSLRTENGFVIAEDGIKYSYQDLAEDAAKTSPPSDPPLKDPSQWRYLGKALPRVDMEAKSTGRAMFGSDVKRDGMLYATVRMNPRLGGPMKSFDATAAEKMPGFKKVVDLGGGVGVIATSTWRAFKAAEAVKIEWGEAPYPAESAEIYKSIAQAFEGGANSTLRDDGNVSDALKGAKSVVEAEYRVPFLAHSTMEPMNATALFDGGRLEIWAGNQAPTIVQEQAAAIAGLSIDDVKVHTPFMGGGFGRRPEYDFTNQAVKLAMQVPGQPVKMTWTREEDTQHDFYRPAAIARMKGVVDGGKPAAVKIDVASISVYRQQIGRFLGIEPPGPDKLLVEGAFDQPYGIPNYQVNGHIADVKVPVGSWRSVGNSYNAFFHECFLDELAFAHKLDPVKMRLELMAGASEPSRKALEVVAEMADWQTPAPENKGRGVAFTYSFGTPTAQIVQVAQTDDGIKIEKLWCAIDVGTALDPRNIEAQVMSAAIYGLSAAVSGNITFKNGEVVQSNYHDYGALRMSQAPEIEVRVLQNNPTMGGVGEPGTPPSMPALANAVYNLTGKRIRELPLGDHLEFVS